MTAQFCHIERWRGYSASSFYVELPDGTALESPSFRWRRTAPPPDHGAPRTAYDELVGLLEEAGWTRHTDGADWFATTFTRLVELQEESVPQPAEKVVPPQLPPAPVTRPTPEPVPAPITSQPVEPPHQPTPPDRSAAREPRAVERSLDPVPTRRRSYRKLPLAAALLATAVAAGFLLLLLLRGHGGNGKSAGAGRTTPRQALLAQPATPPATQGTNSGAGAQATDPTPAKRSLVDVRIAAHGSGSWVEIRRNAATGAVLYRATLPDGKTLHFRAPKLWARFGAASNLTITSNGRPVRLEGTYEKLFVPGR